MEKITMKNYSNRYILSLFALFFIAPHQMRAAAAQTAPGKSKNLFEACINDKIDDVQFWLNQKTDVNAHYTFDGRDYRCTKNPNDNTPLIKAIEKGNIDIVNLLIEHGADIFSIYQRQTPLMHAITKAVSSNNQNYLAIIQSLIQESDKLGRKQEYLAIMDPNMGETALTLAIKTEKTTNVCLDAISILIDHIGINSLDAGGWTPLMRAVHKAHSLAIIDLLIDKGANINAINSYGHTALMVAIREKTTI